MKERRKILWQRFVALLLAITLLLSGIQFGANVSNAEETTSTEYTSMKIEKKNSQNTKTDDWKIYAGTSAETPLVGNPGALKTVKLQVETSLAHGDIYVYAVSGSATLLIQIIGAGETPTKGDYFIVRSGVATYPNSSVGIELTQDAVFVHDGSEWQFTECTSMKIEKKNSQNTKTDDWKIYAGTSAETPLVGNPGALKTVKLQVETSLAHGDIYVYSVSGSATLLIQIIGAGETPTKGDYFIVRSGVATYPNSSVGIELTQDAMFVHDGSEWQFAECTSMKIEKINSQNTKTDDWKIYAGTSAETPLVGNPGALKTVKLQVETSLAHGDISVYSVSGSATLLIQIIGAGETPTKGDYFIVRSGVATYSNSSVGIELTQDAKFVSDGSTWELVTSEEPDQDEPDQDEPQELPCTSVTIKSDTSRNNEAAGKSGIWFTVSPADELSSAGGWQTYLGNIYVDDDLKTGIKFCKALPNLYYLALSDAKITPTKDMKIRIEGKIDDGTNAVEFLPTTFVYHKGIWVLESTLEEESKYKEADVKVYDLYELEGLSTLNIPKGSGLYNLTNLEQQSNVGLRMNIDKLQGEVAFGLAKTVANNVWATSGYQVKVNAEYGFVRLYTMESTTEVRQTQMTGLDLSQAFVLEFGIADLYLVDGGTDVVARRVYIKLNDSEVLSWIDTNLQRSLGTYVPAWSQYGTAVESVDYIGYELQSDTPKVQDISELIDGLSTFTTESVREKKVGRAANATNNAIRMKVKWEAPLKEEGDELLLSFSNNSASGIWVGKDGGYNVLFTPGRIKIGHSNGDSAVVYSYLDIPTEEFLLEIGTYDQNVYKDGQKVKGYSRNVYVKIDGQEILTLEDKNMDRGLGTYFWAYASKNVKANFVSLTSDKYLIRDSVVVSDIYDVTRLSQVSVKTAAEQPLGALQASTNVALRTKVNRNAACQELFFALSKTDSQRFWDLDKSGWEFRLSPGIKRIVIACASDGVLAMKSYAIPEEFILEIGVRNVRYNDGTPYGRELYVSIDGEVALACIDKNSTEKLGTYCATFMSGKDAQATLTSLTTEGYIPVEKNITATDYFDASGYASRKLHNGTTYMGELDNAKNSAIKMRVNVNKDAEEFAITLGKTQKVLHEDTVDENVSGWSVWIKPKYDCIVIQYGYYQTAKKIFTTIPEDFVLEVGSRHSYYQNGKYYGYEVYVKIDGVTVGNWIDDNINNRKLGHHVLAYVNPMANADVTLSTLYATTVLPVEYIINGENAEKPDAVTAETTVVPGKASKLRFTTVTAETYTIKTQGVTLNDTLLTALEIENEQDNVETYEVTAKKGDKIVVKLQKRILTIDEPTTIMDLYDVTGAQQISVPGLGTGAAGNMISNGERQRVNSAIQFKVTMPETGGSVRWGMYSDNGNSWGYNGFIVGLAPGRAGIYNMLYSSLSVNSTNLIQAGKTLYVESGMVKCYEDGNYKYNRLYVKVGDSLDNLTQVAWYDSRERGAYGTTVSFIGMDYKEAYTVHTIGTVRTITDVSTNENKEKLVNYTVFKENRPAVYYPDTVMAYNDASNTKEPASIKLYPQEGMELESLIVSGVNVISNVQKTEDGGYIYVLPSVKNNIQFSYVIKQK